jgi:hypothetical protein
MERGYDLSKPSKPEYYPDSVKESHKVLRHMKNPDLEYYQLSDRSPRTAFMKYMDEKGLEYDKAELKKIIDDTNPVLMSLKHYYNRPRPAQVNDKIIPAKTVSGQTPAYPSGHAYQSYMLARHLAKKHPRHFFSFYSIANRIAKARVSLGLHYPSDNKKAFELAHSM